MSHINSLHGSTFKTLKLLTFGVFFKYNGILFLVLTDNSAKLAGLDDKLIFKASINNFEPKYELKMLRYNFT